MRQKCLFLFVCMMLGGVFSISWRMRCMTPLGKLKSLREEKSEDAAQVKFMDKRMNEKMTSLAFPPVGKVSRQ